MPKRKKAIVGPRIRPALKRRARRDLATPGQAARLTRILTLAVNVLKTRKNAIAWLREPSDALKGMSPLAAIATESGAEKVSNMLHQMEHGIYSWRSQLFL